MFRSKKIVWVVLTIATLALAACSGASKAEPTPDANAIMTAAASTVQAELTRSAALTPSVTPTPDATATPVPTATLATPLATNTPLFTATSTRTPDNALYVSQSVADDTGFSAGQTFKMSWRLKNTGTTTWTTGFRLRFFSGDPLGAPASVNIPAEVKPGAEIDIPVNMKAPATSGTYISNWVLTNAQGANFYNIFLKIKVGDVKSTNTPAPAATAAPTTAPTSGS